MQYGGVISRNKVFNHKAFCPTIKANPFNHQHRNHSFSYCQKKRKSLIFSETEQITRKLSRQKTMVNVNSQMPQQTDLNPQKQFPATLFKLLEKKFMYKNFMGNKKMKTQQDYVPGDTRDKMNITTYKKYRCNKHQELKTTKDMGLKVLYEKYRRNIKNRIGSHDNKRLRTDTQCSYKYTPADSPKFYIDTFAQQKVPQISLVMKPQGKKKKFESTLIYQQRIIQNPFQRNERTPSRLTPWQATGGDY